MYSVYATPCTYSLHTDLLSVTVMPSNPVIGEGGTAQFTAIASGVNIEGFKYQWKKKDGSLSEKVSGVNGAVLTIPNLVDSDEGVYFCTVTNEWNSKKSNDIRLRVEGMYICTFANKRLMNNNQST